MSKVSVRYIVNDVEESIKFYIKYLNFKLEMKPASSFAIISKGSLNLLLSSPSEEGGGGKIIPGKSKPEPGGWNRIHLEVDNLKDEVEKLKNAGASFRNEIVEGVAGRQIILEDPSGNPIELFEYFEK